MKKIKFQESGRVMGVVNNPELMFLTQNPEAITGYQWCDLKAGDIIRLPKTPPGEGWRVDSVVFRDALATFSEEKKKDAHYTAHVTHVKDIEAVEITDKVMSDR